MKRIALILAAAAAALAQQPPATLWYHGGLAVGSINKGAGGVERWGELDLINTGAHTRSLTVIVRRWSGQLILEQNYTLAGGEKRTVRIDDPATNVDVADGINERSLDVLRCGVLVEPLTPEINIALRKMDLRGDQLKTTDLSRAADGGPCCREWPRTHLYVLRRADMKLLASNLDGKPRRVVMCESVTSQFCTGPSSAVTIPAYSVYLIPTSESTLPYILVAKPKNVIVEFYYRVEGTTSTFNVNSGITFGATVDPKKE
jgi:hypothetical protein